MSIAACYVINVQCDRLTAHTKDEPVRDQFTGESKREAMAALRRAGWRVSDEEVACRDCTRRVRLTTGGAR